MHPCKYVFHFHFNNVSASTLNKFISKWKINRIYKKIAQIKNSYTSGYETVYA